MDNKWHVFKMEIQGDFESCGHILTSNRTPQ
jgi:hypothetical protein